MIFASFIYSFFKVSIDFYVFRENWAAKNICCCWPTCEAMFCIEFIVKNSTWAERYAVGVLMKNLVYIGSVRRRRTAGGWGWEWVKNSSRGSFLGKMPFENCIYSRIKQVFLKCFFFLVKNKTVFFSFLFNLL